MHSLHIKSRESGSSSCWVENVRVSFWILWHRNSPPVVNLFSHLFNGKCLWLFIYIWGGVIIQCNFIILLLKLFLFWLLGALSVDSCALWHTPIPHGCVFVCMFGPFLLSDSTRCCKFMLYVSHLSPGIGRFSKEFWFPFLENRIINQDLGAEGAYCYWCIISLWSSHLTEQGYICVCTNPWVSVHICICDHRYLYWVKHEFPLRSPTLMHYHVDRSSLLSLFICEVLLQQWKISLSLHV